MPSLDDLLDSPVRVSGEPLSSIAADSFMIMSNAPSCSRAATSVSTGVDPIVAATGAMAIAGVSGAVPKKSLKDLVEEVCSSEGSRVSSSSGSSLDPSVRLFCPICQQLYPDTPDFLYKNGNALVSHMCDSHPAYFGKGVDLREK